MIIEFQRKVSFAGMESESKTLVEKWGLLKKAYKEMSFEAMKMLLVELPVVIMRAWDWRRDWRVDEEGLLERKECS